MNNLRRTMTLDDVEQLKKTIDEDREGSGSSDEEWTDEETLEMNKVENTTRHRRYRSGTQPDYYTITGLDHEDNPNKLSVFKELSMIFTITLLIVTPIAARQLGSLLARRLLSRIFGKIIY